MSKYTTQIRRVVEMNSTEGQSISKRIEEACPKIFNFDYPLWAESYKPVLEKKILMHYINKEIGFETLGLWKLYLEERLNLILPYYNQLYETTSRKYDYLVDVNETEKYEGEKQSQGNVQEDVTSKQLGTANSDTTSTGNEDTSVEGSKTLESLKSDLPQANYGGADYGTDLQEDKATDSQTVGKTATSNSTATSESENTLTGNNKTDTSSQTQDLYTRTRNGLTGARSSTQLLMEYRSSLINIDKLIIEELYDLFMLIY